jgi:hypothetical protein
VQQVILKFYFGADKVTTSNLKSSFNNYSFDINRALYKKQEATKRLQHVEYKHTNGDVVIITDAATFELFKTSIQ